ncbi:alpha/beta hydrolase [Limnovirga soli]|jgi:enterochelin esterase-like enzyme|uniref:Esterase n=1 Tax=Limnovirga soli TaxID=2656915 RepID=A0A8J8JV46_9BACT|nr:alpha/beta hydrolase-fold protein [Limnovirga soli]NNV56239.1 esterase [Limnovirga soli]
MAQENLNVSSVLVERSSITSTYLERTVLIDAYLPTNIANPSQLSLLLINDGQDLPKMPFANILGQLLLQNAIEPLVCIGIHCGEDRRMEYGTANTPDYLGRGGKATAYTNFIFEELIPFIQKTYALNSFKEKSFAGFSLGALSAMDIGWNHPHTFSKLGLFSGSFWWRSKAYEDGYNDDTDRIMHQQVKLGNYSPQLRFFFQCGALDETKDRNNNGIIDSIDDVLDLISMLKTKGYTDEQIKYLELPDGQHNVETWGRALPAFLQWGWGK